MSIGVPPLSQYKSVEPSSAVVKCYMFIVIKHQYKYSKPAIHFIKSIITTNIYMFTKSQYLILFLSIRPFEPLKVLVTESWFFEGCVSFSPRKLSIQHFYQLFVKKRGEMNLTNGAVAIEIHWPSIATLPIVVCDCYIETYPHNAPALPPTKWMLVKFLQNIVWKLRLLHGKYSLHVGRLYKIHIKFCE